MEIKDTIKKNKEAIREITECIEWAKHMDCEEVEKVSVRTLKLAKAALKKQVPKKVICRHNLSQFYNELLYFCPTCKKEVYPIDPYCLHCGQKLNGGDDK